MNSLIRSSCAALLLLGALSCAQSDSTGARDTAVESPAAEQSQALATPPLRELSQDELDRYLAFIVDMRAEPASPEAQLTGDPGRLLAFLTGAPAQGRVTGYMDAQGFTQRRLADVHYNMSMAYGALLLDENRSEIEGERVRQQQTIEAMRGKVSDEQLAAMKAAMESAQSRVADAYAGVPAANKALLRKNSDRLRATFGP